MATWNAAAMERRPDPRAARALRRATIVLFALLVPLSALGCGAQAATASPEAAASEEPEMSFPEDTPLPSGVTLLEVSGTGTQTSKEFHASGESVAVSWTYQCAAASGGSGTFALYFYGAEGVPALSDELTNGFGTDGDDAVAEPLNGNTGPFTLEVDSGCSWTVKVVGKP